MGNAWATNHNLNSINHEYPCSIDLIYLQFGLILHYCWIIKTFHFFIHVWASSIKNIIKRKKDDYYNIVHFNKSYRSYVIQWHFQDLRSHAKWTNSIHAWGRITDWVQLWTTQLIRVLKSKYLVKIMRLLKMQQNCKLFYKFLFFLFFHYVLHNFYFYANKYQVKGGLSTRGMLPSFAKDGSQPSMYNACKTRMGACWDLSFVKDSSISLINNQREHWQRIFLQP